MVVLSFLAFSVKTLSSIETQGNTTMGALAQYRWDGEETGNKGSVLSLFEGSVLSLF